MGQAAGATQSLRVALRYCPIADVLAVVVGTQAIRLVLAARSLIAPQTVVTVLHGGHEVPVGQVGQRVAAVEAADVLEEHQMLTMCAMKGFHLAPGSDPRASPRPGWPALARLAPENEPNSLPQGTVQTANRFIGNTLLCQQLRGLPWKL
jgi:hypothetical protein